MEENEVIDLTLNSDGTYSDKSIKKVEADDPLIEKPRPIKSKQPKKKNENVTQFFEGCDAGLDFLDDVTKRITRFIGIIK